MGLFASRKVDSSSLPLSYGVVPATAHTADKSVAQFIRARFNAGKLRQVKLGFFNSTSTTRAPYVERVREEPLHRLKQSYPSVESTSDVPSHRSERSISDRRNEVPFPPVQKLHQIESHRTSSDPVTMTLAERLKELATAHADGLLNGDDYRVLRQNLFNSFASQSLPPMESPIVKSVEPSSTRLSSASRNDCSTINSTRAPSLLTQTTNGSTISERLNRAWKRTTRKNKKDYDGASVVSSSSWTPYSIDPTSSTHDLSRQASSNSLKRDRSRMPPDLRSVSSRRSGNRIITTSDTEGLSRKSTRSLRGFEPPPSSFNAKHLSPRLLSWDGNGDRLQSIADIRAEIYATETEQRSVLTAFSLLGRRRFGGTSLGNPQLPDSWAMIPGRMPPGSELYAGYIMSAPELRPDNEVSYVRRDLDDAQSNPNADEIEQRMEEISARYQHRLDYLRARLKGAELHERLLRK